MNSAITLSRSLLLRLMIGAGLAATLIYGYSWLKNPTNFPINLVRVEGQLQYINTNILEDTIAPYAGHGFFSINVDKLRRVLLALPWIEQVTLHRVWPDQLKVKVTEMVPVARLGGDKLISRDGTILSLSTTKQEITHLPVLKGPRQQLKNMLFQWQKIDNILKSLNLKVKWLALSERHAWDAQLSNDMLLHLGKDDVLNRLQRFVSIYKIVKNQPQQTISYADLRYSNGVAFG